MERNIRNKEHKDLTRPKYKQEQYSYKNTSGEDALLFAVQHSPGNVNLDSSRHGLDVFIEDIDDICVFCVGASPTH